MAGLPRAGLGWGLGSMERHSILLRDHKFIEPARCDKCGGNARLIRRSPHPVEGLEVRIFECQECGGRTKRFVKA